MEDLNEQYFTELRQIKDGDIGQLAARLYQHKRQAFQDHRSRTVMKSGNTTGMNSASVKYATVKKKVLVPSHAQLKGTHHQSNHSQSTHSGLVKISKLMNEMKDGRHSDSGWSQFNFQKRDRYRSELSSKNNIPGPSTTSEGSKPEPLSGHNANAGRSQEKIILKNLSHQKKSKQELQPIADQQKLRQPQIHTQVPSSKQTLEVFDPNEKARRPKDTNQIDQRSDDDLEVQVPVPQTQMNRRKKLDLPFDLEQARPLESRNQK